MLTEYYPVIALVLAAIVIAFVANWFKNRNKDKAG